jgi:hypothetical protein
LVAQAGFLPERQKFPSVQKAQSLPAAQRSLPLRLSPMLMAGFRWFVEFAAFDGSYQSTLNIAFSANWQAFSDYASWENIDKPLFSGT